MNDSIISRDVIRARARTAFNRGAGRSEWDRCMVEKVQDQRRATGAVMQQLATEH